MKSTFGGLSLAITSLAACGPVDDTLPLGSHQSAIMGGTVDAADPGVVAFHACPPNEPCWYCTGALVSPRVILTAAHCVDPPPDTATVLFGSLARRIVDDGVKDATFLGLRDMAAFTAHPGWAGGGGLYLGYDIGLIQMTEPAPPEAPILPIHRGSLGGYVGSDLRIVGFGGVDADANGFGIKRTLTTPLLGFDPRVPVAGLPLLRYGDATHNIFTGDSGGPNFATIEQTEVVAGVTSHGEDFQDAYSTDVSSHQQFIDEWIAGHDPDFACGPGNGCATGCPVVDPDCPCAADGFCTPQCKPPGSDPDCSACEANGVCVPTGCTAPDPDCDACGDDGTCMPGCEQDPDCSQACGADGTCNKTCTTDPDCTAACGLDGQCDSTCTPRDPDCPLAAVGQACARNDDCTSTLCVLPSNGTDPGYCTQACDSASPTCPTGMQCAPGATGATVCLRDGSQQQPTTPTTPAPPAAAPPGDDGGCAVAALPKSASDHLAWWFGTLAALWLFVRRGSGPRV